MSAGKRTVITGGPGTGKTALIRELERGGALAALHEDAVPALAAYDSPYAIHDADGRLRAAERGMGAGRARGAPVRPSGATDRLEPHPQPGGAAACGDRPDSR